MNKIRSDHRKRIKKLKFGDPITNVSAPAQSAKSHSYFVRYSIRCSLLLKDHMIECTDKKGKFWHIDAWIIYPGRLKYEEREKIYSTIHSAYG